VTRIESRAPIVAGILALGAALAAGTSDLIGVFHDDGIYLLTAQALAEGQGFTYASLPGSPPAIHYPPLWPLTLAGLVLVTPPFPDNVLWLKLLNPLLLGGVAAGAVVFARAELGLSNRAAFGAAILAVVAVPVLLLSSFLLSEPLFLALLMPALLLAERFVRDGDRGTGVAAAVLTALVVLTRTIGIALPVAVGVLLLQQRRWRDLATFGGIAGLLILPWQLFVWREAVGFAPELRGSYGPYLEWAVQGIRDGGLAFLGATIERNAVDLHAFFSLMALPRAAGALRALCGVVAIVAILVGAVELWRGRRGRVTLLAMAGYLGISLGWPFQADRFLWALWPLLALVAVAGLVQLVARLRTARPRAALAVASIAILLVAGHVASAIDNVRRGVMHQASRERNEIGTLLARAVNLEPRLRGMPIASDLAPLVGLYTGGVVLPLESLSPAQHLTPKGVEDHRREIEAIDARFQPAAYVTLRDSRRYEALAKVSLSGGRRLTDVSAPASRVRILLVHEP
jgi:hypothetical protein